MTTNHLPKSCSSCSAPIYWAQLPSKKSVPVDVEPTPDGNILLFDRDGSVQARVLKKGEEPPPGAKRRLSHFVTCPHAAKHRKIGRHGDPQ